MDLVMESRSGPRRRYFALGAVMLLDSSRNWPEIEDGPPVTGYGAPGPRMAHHLIQYAITSRNFASHWTRLDLSEEAVVIGPSRDLCVLRRMS